MMEALLEHLEGRIRQVAEEVYSAHATKAAPPSVDELDEVTRAAIREQILIAHKTYLNRKEAAKYLGVSPRSIAEWAARPADQNPFPECQAGGEPRVKRTAVDEWAAREKQRQRLKLAG